MFYITLLPRPGVITQIWMSIEGTDSSGIVLCGPGNVVDSSLLQPAHLLSTLTCCVFTLFPPPGVSACDLTTWPGGSVTGGINSIGGDSMRTLVERIQSAPHRVRLDVIMAAPAATNLTLYLS